MARRPKVKKINMTLPEWLWEELMKRSKEEEYMPMATFTRRLLIDAFRKKKIEEDEIQ
jgi:hypothetical protein